MFFGFIVPVKRTDNLNLRSEICDVASAWLQDCTAEKQNHVEIKCEQSFLILSYESFCNIPTYPNDLAVFLQHHPFNTKIIIYAAQCAAILQ